MLKRCAFLVLAARAFVSLPWAQHVFPDVSHAPLGGVETVSVPVAPAQFEPMINRSAAAYHVDPALVKAVIANESGFRSVATSSVGAQGLMQLMPSTAASLGVHNSYDPAQNVAGGTRYLRGLYDRFGDWHLAVAAYNAGPGAVRYYGGVPPYPETQNYVHAVFRTLQHYVVSDRLKRRTIVHLSKAEIRRRHIAHVLASEHAWQRHQHRLLALHRIAVQRHLNNLAHAKLVRENHARRLAEQQAHHQHHNRSLAHASNRRIVRSFWDMHS